MMKLNRKHMLQTLILAGLLLSGFFSCDKIPLDVIRDQIRDQREPVKILKKFGVKVNEQTGEIEVFYGGRQIPIQKAGMNYVSNTIINNQVTLAQIRYTPLGCNDFDTANGKNLRTFAVDFRNTSGNTFQYVVPTNVTGSNVFGISGSVGTNIAPSTGPLDVFTIAFVPALKTCNTFSFYFDLSDGFTD